MTANRRRSPLRLLVICLGTALALAGALVLPTIAPTYKERYRPLHRDGAVGQMIVTRDFRIRVHPVKVAKSLVTKVSGIGLSSSKTRTVYTDAVWVVIVADVGATRKKLDILLLQGGLIHTRDGTVYKPETNLPTKLGNTLDDPVPLGPTQKQLFFFQVPRDRLTGAYFEVTDEQLKWDDDPKPWEEQWFLPAARVSLGFDTPAATANALRRAPEPLRIPEGLS